MPLKIVIVEDNPTTVRSLVQTIHWDELDCVVAATASDGESGRRAVLEQRPDILLTDICMPQMNGLEMIESVRQELPDCKVIIVTGYDQFEYASQAIKLAVFDYILKPIHNDEVERSIRRAAATMQQKRENDSTLEQALDLKQRSHLLLLLTNDSQRGQGVGDMLADADMRFQTYYIMMLQCQDPQAPMPLVLNRLEAIYRGMSIRVVMLLLYDSVVAFVMRDDGGVNWREEAENIYQHICNEMQVPVHVGVSGLGTSRHHIRQIYHQARQAVWEVALRRGLSGICYYREEQRRYTGERVAELQNKVEAMIEKADLTDESAIEAARVLAEQSGKQYSNLRALVTFYSMELQKKFHCPHDERMENALCATWFVSCEEDAERCLVRLCQAMRSAIENDETARLSLLTRNALQYVRLHAIEGVRLDDVAQKLCVSTNYLSALIRKETGITFHEHVLDAKMTVARTMLADPRILVEEVAHAIGYGNYISFYNAFKRIEHMTPTEYRNQKAGL